MADVQINQSRDGHVVSRLSFTGILAYLCYIVKASLFITSFGICSVFCVIMVKMFIDVFFTCEESQGINIRFAISTIFIPLILLSLVPDFKYLAPVSTIANLCIGTCLVITFYVLVKDGLPSIGDRHMSAELSDLPKFISRTIFAIEAISIMLPLENQMRHPKHFVKVCGVLNGSMLIVTMVFVVVGLLGYIKYGDEVKALIIMSLASHTWESKVAESLAAIAIFASAGIHILICLEILWDAVKDYFPNHPKVANYGARVGIAVGAVTLAIAVPQIGPAISFLGAFTISILGLFIPVVIESAIAWNDGFGPFNYLAIKNVALIILSFGVIGFGTFYSTLDIIKELSKIGPNNCTSV